MSHFNVRHPRARADSEIEKEHDTFSMVKFISREFPDVEAQVKIPHVQRSIAIINFYIAQQYQKFYINNKTEQNYV